jgi:hypothetical protein
MVAGEIERVQKPRLERLGITAERVLHEIALMAFANMLDYMTIKDGRIAEFDYSRLTRDQAASIQAITTDIIGGAGDGERQLVCGPVSNWAISVEASNYWASTSSSSPTK